MLLVVLELGLQILELDKALFLQTSLSAPHHLYSIVDLVMRDVSHRRGRERDSTDSKAAGKSVVSRTGCVPTNSTISTGSGVDNEGGVLWRKSGRDPIPNRPGL